MSLLYDEAVDGIQSYCACFTANVPNVTRDRWVNLLIDRTLNADPEILSRAITRCAENDLGPSWSRLRKAISIERGLAASKRFEALDGSTDDFDRWADAYRAEGLSAGYPSDPRSTSDNSARTSPDLAAVCWKVCYAIAAKVIVYPQRFRDRQNEQPDEEEKEWFWSQVASRVKRK